MYRQKIREYYDHLSPSYRKVADFILGHYYEVAFMTAAQLAAAVDVDTTTVVRFAQRLGYHGYPDLLEDVRAQVREEVYGVHRPEPLPLSDPAAVFAGQVERDRANLHHILVQNPPSHLQAALTRLARAERIFFVAEGYVGPVTEMIAAQLRHQDIRAEAVSEDPVKRAATLANVTPQDVVVGVSAAEHGENVARALAFARRQGCPIIGVVGALEGPVSRASDVAIYAPSESAGPLSSMVSLTAALTALAQTIVVRDVSNANRRRRAFSDAYHFLTHPGSEQPARVVAHRN
ncbi:MAG: MurR/RpiR family transcriptional regulator [Caldilineae bacterium]|nr:MAG: MurR/RpiR family transcriptional regulator [Caldilineae bacterium]